MARLISLLVDLLDPASLGRTVASTLPHMSDHEIDKMSAEVLTCARPWAALHACGWLRAAFCTAGSSVISVPPWPSPDAAKAGAVERPSNAVLAVWMPSVTLSVPALLPFGV